MPMLHQSNSVKLCWQSWSKEIKWPILSVSPHVFITWLDLHFFFIRWPILKWSICKVFFVRSSSPVSFSSWSWNHLCADQNKHIIKVFSLLNNQIKSLPLCRTTNIIPTTNVHHNVMSAKRFCMRPCCIHTMRAGLGLVGLLLNHL